MSRYSGALNLDLKAFEIQRVFMGSFDRVRGLVVPVRRVFSDNDVGRSRSDTVCRATLGNAHTEVIDRLA